MSIELMWYLISMVDDVRNVFSFVGGLAIVASAIPLAVGCAFANKRQNNGKTVAVFFGDGAIDEGVFWESLNAACIMKLPVLFVCEDNDLAVHTTAKQRHGYESISKTPPKKSGGTGATHFFLERYLKKHLMIQALHCHRHLTRNCGTSSWKNTNPLLPCWQNVPPNGHSIRKILPC